MAQAMESTDSPVDTLCPRRGQKVDPADATYAVEQHEVETTVVEQLEIQSAQSDLTLVGGIGRYFHRECFPTRDGGIASARRSLRQPPHHRPILRDGFTSGVCT